MSEVRSKKGIDIGIILFLALMLIFLALNAPKIQNSFKPTLEGTYRCEKFPFGSFVFDKENNYSFIFDNFILSEPGKFSRELDKGSYAKKTDTLYVINSPKFNNLEIKYNLKNQSIKIKTDEGSYTCKQVSTNPMINISNYE
ncbi:hypothetical protein V7146_04985 [Gottfriedia acidiceleris]|uniref:hypothetical protein n=1 Tax=Gottfriedia acidiceleris TaxID=371036 RepID=UPI002FFF595F